MGLTRLPSVLLFIRLLRSLRFWDDGSHFTSNDKTWDQADGSCFRCEISKIWKISCNFFLAWLRQNHIKLRKANIKITEYLYYTSERVIYSLIYRLFPCADLQDLHSQKNSSYIHLSSGFFSCQREDICWMVYSKSKTNTNWSRIVNFEYLLGGFQFQNTTFQATTRWRYEAVKTQVYVAELLFISCLSQLNSLTFFCGVTFIFVHIEISLNKGIQTSN